MEYERFEEDVAQRSAEFERAVHAVALSSLDVDAPFVCVWGKTCRRVCIAYNVNTARSRATGP